MAFPSDRHVEDLNSHLGRGKTICEPVYERLPLMMDMLPEATTVDGKLVIKSERRTPDGSPVREKAACFGKPDDAIGKPGNVHVLKRKY